MLLCYVVLRCDAMRLVEVKWTGSHDQFADTAGSTQNAGSTDSWLMSTVQPDMNEE